MFKSDSGVTCNPTSLFASPQASLWTHNILVHAHRQCRTISHWYKQTYPYKDKVEYPQQCPVGTTKASFRKSERHSNKPGPFIKISRRSIIPSSISTYSGALQNTTVMSHVQDMSDCNTLRTRGITLAYSPEGPPRLAPPAHTLVHRRTGPH